jgi:hypothetical protein
VVHAPAHVHPLVRSYASAHTRECADPAMVLPHSMLPLTQHMHPLTPAMAHPLSQCMALHVTMHLLLPPLLPLTQHVHPLTPAMAHPLVLMHLHGAHPCIHGPPPDRALAPTSTCAQMHPAGLLRSLALPAVRACSPAFCSFLLASAHSPSGNARSGSR